MFLQLYLRLRAEKDPGSTWHKNVKLAAGGVERFVIKKSESADNEDSHTPSIENEQAASGPYHSVLVEERVWTANWVNQYAFTKNNNFDRFHILFSSSDILLTMLI